MPDKGGELPSKIKNEAMLLHFIRQERVLSTILFFKDSCVWGRVIFLHEKILPKNQSENEC